MSEINVTPLVDVMLVLLIVFMVTAPMLTVGIPMELPKTEAKALGGEKEPLTISVTSEGKIYIQDKEIAMDELVPKLKAISNNGYNERIYIRGDQESRHGKVSEVLGKISSAGFTRLAIVTDSSSQ
ncbi:MAG: protein TolR [Rhodomicrobium sp.]|nr:MAG: protein TolR [Rhodomicrobium sp.]